MIALQEKQRRTGTYKQIRRETTSNTTDAKPDTKEGSSMGNNGKNSTEAEEVKKEPVEATEEAMMAMMGFGDFSTTKNLDHGADAAEGCYKTFI